MVPLVVSDRRLRNRQGEYPNLEVLAFQKAVQRFFHSRFQDSKVHHTKPPTALSPRLSSFFCNAGPTATYFLFSCRLRRGTVLGVRRWNPPLIEANPRNLGDIINGSLKSPGSGLIAEKATFTSTGGASKKRPLFPFQPSSPRACTITRRTSQLRVGPFLPSSPRLPRLPSLKLQRRAHCEA